jgi:hypothetical protein
MKQFETVAQMKLARLTAGQTVTTKGYYAAGDAGGATYLVAASQTVDGYGDHALANGNVTLLQGVDGEYFVDQFGAKGDDSTDDFLPIHAAYDAAANGGTVVFGGKTYLTTDSINGGRVSCRSTGNGRLSTIHYTGSDYALRHEGTGSEGGSPKSRFSLNDLWLTGSGNSNSLGGLLVDRCFSVAVNNVYSTNWANASSVSVRITNVFNLRWDGGQITNGSTSTAGGAALEVGSFAPDAWNSSNISFVNILIQQAGSNGVNVIHDSNVLDNLSFENVSFGKNKGWSFRSVVENINNIVFKNCHFESPGFNGTATPESGKGHLQISNAKNVSVCTNSMQDAQRYAELNNVDGFYINNNRCFETGTVTLTGTQAWVITATDGDSVGTIANNSIRRDQVDTETTTFENNGYTVDIDIFTRKRVDEATWGDAQGVEANPTGYVGTIVNRVGSSGAPFDQMYTGDGVNWGRMMFSTLYRGESTAIPTGATTQGGFYFKSNPVEQGTVGDKYTVLGWQYYSGAWNEMRVLTGN